MSSTFKSRWRNFVPKTANYGSPKRNESTAALTFATFGTLLVGRSENTQATEPAPTTPRPLEPASEVWVSTQCPRCRGVLLPLAALAADGRRWMPCADCRRLIAVPRGGAPARLRHRARPAALPMRTATESRRREVELETTNYGSAKSDESPVALTSGTFGTPIIGRSGNTRSELVRLAGDAVEPITLHCQTCETCRPEAFVGDVVQFPLCRWGRELRRDYREARRQALDACRAAERRAAEADGKAGEQLALPLVAVASEAGEHFNERPDEYRHRHEEREDKR